MGSLSVRSVLTLKLGHRFLSTLLRSAMTMEVTSLFSMRPVVGSSGMLKLSRLGVPRAMAE